MIEILEEHICREEWQLKLLSLVTPWWLAVLPRCVELLWNQAVGKSPVLTSILSVVAYTAICLGFLYAVFDLIEVEGAQQSSPEEKVISRWFIGGVFTIPLFLVILPAWSGS